MNEVLEALKRVRASLPPRPDPISIPASRRCIAQVQAEINRLLPGLSWGCFCGLGEPFGGVVIDVARATCQRCSRSPD